MIELSGIKKYYSFGKEKFYALNGIDAAFETGKISSIFGNSGSGKTTLGNIISGFEKQDEGIVLYNGSREKKSKTIRNVFQDPYISLNSNKDVRWHIETTANLNSLNQKVLWENLEITGMEKERYGSRYISSLSGGERQRLAFSVVMSQQPEFIVLDEPFSYLDTLNMFNLLQLLKKMKKVISFIYLDHDLNRCAYISDYIYILKDGQIVEHGKTQAIVENPVNSFTRSVVENLPDLDKLV
jgi:peptide/nickel transport system ATP-binding protein